MSSPTSYINKLNVNLQRTVSENLDLRSFVAFSQSSKSLAAALSNQSNPRVTFTRKAEKLAFCILNINDVRKSIIKKLLDTKEIDESNKTDKADSKALTEAQISSMILKRVTAEELFYNTNRRRKLWVNSSPLELAASNGDINLTAYLLNRVHKDQYEEATSQIKGVLALQNEPGRYMPELFHFRDVYKLFIEEQMVDGYKSYRWDELNKIFVKLENARNHLPWYIIQLFCSHFYIEHRTIRFTEEPNRVCRLRDNIILKLPNIEDNISTLERDPKQTYVLFKGSQYHPLLWRGMDTTTFFSEIGRDHTRVNCFCDQLPVALDELSKTPGYAYYVEHGEYPKRTVRKI